ncbi:MAG: hypothetical protein IPN17_30120 [Deltaproteobacteria bacterium]|nr:hypothetical protein [Deltaproteobacteria bacterium]
MATPKRAQPKSSRPTKPSPTPAARVADVVHLSRARRQEFDDLLSTIAAQLGRERSQWDLLWEKVGEALEGEVPLYRAKFTTLKAFIAKVLPGESERSVKRNVLVAGCFTAADEKRHGVTVLEDIALFVMAQTGARIAPKAIDLDRLKIPVPGVGGSLAMKPARECTQDDLRRARRALSKGRSAKPASAREKALRVALAKVKSLKAIGVSERADGFTLSKVPAEGFAALGKVLTTLKVPAEG